MQWTLSLQHSTSIGLSLKNLQTHFQAEHNPAVIGDISTGAMYLVTMGSFASLEPWRFDAKWRLRYRDN